MKIVQNHIKTSKMAIKCQNNFLGHTGKLNFFKTRMHAGTGTGNPYGQINPSQKGPILNLQNWENLILGKQ